ncbi:hypothetical protein K438DRAFT_1759769 [Mycena galopus ATCC 62051]|nr:hypothetical protein K438DRAFT_1759769 [Mycena galopus ATCC 62051]
MPSMTPGSGVCRRTVAKAMVDGHPSGAQHGHQAMESCVTEWQQHCLLGVHPHPLAPVRIDAAPAQNIRRGPVDPELQAQRQKYRMPDLMGLSLRNLSGKLSEELLISSATEPEVAQYFALWGGRIVYADRPQAKEAFLAAQVEGLKLCLLSTSDYDEAQAYSEAVHWPKHQAHVQPNFVYWVTMSLPESPSHLRTSAPPMDSNAPPNPDLAPNPDALPNPDPAPNSDVPGDPDSVPNPDAPPNANLRLSP